MKKNVQTIITVCDYCGKDNGSTNKCHYCQRDVCRYCSAKVTQTHHEYNSEGTVGYDHPIVFYMCTEHLPQRKLFGWSLRQK